MSLKKDNDDLAKLVFGILNEDCGHCAEDHDKEEEDAEDLNPMRRFNYFLSQLNDMKQDLDMGDSADSTIFQEIRHVAEQIMTWCDDQDGSMISDEEVNPANPENGQTVLQGAGQNGTFN